jgi:hypothetical protein
MCSILAGLDKVLLYTCTTSSDKSLTGPSQWIVYVRVYHQAYPGKTAGTNSRAWFVGQTYVLIWFVCLQGGVAN